MEISRREIKSRAIMGVKGDYFKSVLFCFFAIFYHFLLKIITFYQEKVLPSGDIFIKLSLDLALWLLFSLTSSLVLFLLFRWHYNKICGAENRRKPSVSKALRLNFVLLLNLFLCAFFFLLPAALLHFSTVAIKLSDRFFPSDIIMLILDILSVILALLCGLFVFLFMTRYLLCWAVLTENPSVSVRTAIKISVKMMKGEKTGAFRFLLSLLPFLLFSAFIIPAFYYLPKTVSSICLYEKYIIEKNRISFPMLSYK